MRKSVFYLALVFFFPAALAFGAGRVEGPRREGEISFDRLLDKLTEEYEKGLKLPAPPSEKALASPGLEDRYWVTVKATDKYERTKLLEAGLSIEEIRPGSVSGTIHKNSLARLTEKDFIVESRKTLAQYLRDDVKDFPAADSAYNNYKEATEILKSIAAKNPDIASLFSIGKTIEGRDIWTLRVNTSAKGETPSGKPGAFYIGTHHAREHLATEVPLLFAVWLLDNRDAPEIKKYIETLDIYITPILNPDGLEYDIRTGKYQLHRKNTRINADKSVGVDLNRNYDSWWCTAGSSSYPGSDTYCGTAPFSEPETQAVKKFVEARKNLKTLMSYHSFSDLILYPWGGKDAPVEDERDRKVFVKMAGEMAAVTGYTPQLSSDLYVATGDTADWAYKAGKIFAFTTELEGGTFYPGTGIIARTVKNNVKAAVYMLSVSDNPYKVVN